MSLETNTWKAWYAQQTAEVLTGEEPRLRDEFLVGGWGAPKDLLESLGESGLSATNSVYDIGSGVNPSTAGLVASGFDVTAVDVAFLNQEMVFHARDIFQQLHGSTILKAGTNVVGNISFVPGAIEALTFSQPTHIVLSSVINYIPRQALRDLIVRNRRSIASITILNYTSAGLSTHHNLFDPNRYKDMRELSFDLSYSLGLEKLFGLNASYLNRMGGLEQFLLGCYVPEGFKESAEKQALEEFTQDWNSKLEEFASAHFPRGYDLG
ncbi:MAG: hypothetical protein ACOCXP_03875 [Candidatus Dojkabacteria bacterium]